MYTAFFTIEFAFEGLLPGGSVAVSTNGCIQDKMDRRYFQNGLTAMVAALQPETIVNYSQTPTDIFGKYVKQGIHVVNIENYKVTVCAKVAGKAAP